MEIKEEEGKVVGFWVSVREKKTIGKDMDVYIRKENTKRLPCPH